MHPQIHRWQLAADALEIRLGQIRSEHRTLATTNEGRDVQALIDHVLEVQATYGRLLGGIADPGESWDAIRSSTATAVGEPGALDGTVDAPDIGVAPRERMLAIATNDMLIHTWDISRAIGVDDTLPVACLEAAIEGIEAFPPDLRSQFFATPVDVDPSASLQDRMLGIAGRQP